MSTYLYQFMLDDSDKEYVEKMENIRENWTECKKDICNEKKEKVWLAWCDKFNKNIHNTDISLLKKFIDGHVTNTKKISYNKTKKELILSNYNNKQRYRLHTLCDELGLHHKSMSVNNKRILHIYIPEPWLWEYSEKNPYLESPEFYEEKRKKAIEREEKEKKERIDILKKRYCSLCDISAYDTDLFGSLRIRGLYCSDCLENESDGEGNELLAYKFELLYSHDFCFI